MTARGPACLLAVALACASPSYAHEVRPAYLQVTATAAGGCTVLWKQPVMGETQVHLVPHLSAGWLDDKPATLSIASGFLLESWKIAPGLCRPLDGQAVWIEGLQDTITDALVMVHKADGSTWQGILTPAQPRQVLPAGSSQPTGTAGFLMLGLGHILSGPDHLLFVFGLLLLIGNRWALLKTVTAFTIAHSITLAIATLGYATVSTPFVNAAIALSICFLGREIVRKWHGETSLTIRYPWLVAFAFGLLHGFGFASGLTSLGLPRDALPVALLLFNVGVECGQLVFLVIALLLLRALRALDMRMPRSLHQSPGYLVGAFGAFWSLQWVLVMLAGHP